jgi:hypothetical protein
MHTSLVLFVSIFVPTGAQLRQRDVTLQCENVRDPCCSWQPSQDRMQLSHISCPGTTPVRTPFAGLPFNRVSKGRSAKLLHRPSGARRPGLFAIDARGPPGRYHDTLSQCRLVQYDAPSTPRRRLALQRGEAPVLPRGLANSTRASHCRAPFVRSGAGGSDPAASMPWHQSISWKVTSSPVGSAPRYRSAGARTGSACGQMDRRYNPVSRRTDYAQALGADGIAQPAAHTRWNRIDRKRSFPRYVQAEVDQKTSVQRAPAPPKVPAKRGAYHVPICARPNPADVQGGCRLRQRIRCQTRL